jgi:hypothetical protein
VLGQHDERLATPQRGSRATAGDGSGADGAPGRRDRDARRDEDRDEDHRDEQDGRAGGTEAGVQWPAHDCAEIPAGTLERVRVRERRRVLGELGEAAHSDQSEHGADSEAPRVGALGLIVSVLVVLGARLAVDEQRDAGAGRHERQERTDPAGQHREAGVGAAPDGAELTAPQRERQQDAERDQRDGPQIAGLHPPERRARRSCGRGPAAPGGGFLGGGAGGRTRARGAPTAGLGHHSRAETTA